VERTFAWLGNYRRLLIRWERLFTVYRAWFAVALFRICLRRWVHLDAQRRHSESQEAEGSL
jgi:hypothetical protein